MRFKRGDLLHLFVCLVSLVVEKAWVPACAGMSQITKAGAPLPYPARTGSFSPAAASSAPPVPSNSKASLPSLSVTLT
jgi:hypothetical protein